MLALDLGVLHRESRAMDVRQALGWTVVWIAGRAVVRRPRLRRLRVSLVRLAPGRDDAPDGAEAAIQFVTGYLLEWSLSVDNIFVIAVIFTFMKIPPQYPVPRAVLGHRRRDRAARRDDRDGRGADPRVRLDVLRVRRNPAVSPPRACSRARRSSSIRARACWCASRDASIRSPTSWTASASSRVDGARAATPLFVTLLLVDFADVVFAVDSIPAIFAVTQEPFIVFTSNAFAILGLRSLYFAIAGLMMMFKYIKLSLIFILGFVGVKMMLHHHMEIPHAISLGVIVGFLAIGIVASLWSTRREQRASAVDD